mmetsp:Transcript_22774/g.70750  ORF Transcript_22774/g.70750 Transcript_22774/m.70750 type:complete len:157 (-) Transcript_22774:86-556(-)
MMAGHLLLGRGGAHGLGFGLGRALLCSQQQQKALLRPLASEAAVSAGGGVGGEPAAAQGGVLLRDFIHDSLYNPVYGYFVANASVVGAMPSPIDFRNLTGRSHYLQEVSLMYKQLDASWLTPAEIFQPWYSASIAEHILRQHAARGGQRGEPYVET